MLKGDVVADRFEIDRPVGSGGMGRVYRALDRLTGETIALKLLHRADPQERLRFAREARALATLRHPGIVRYVAHGTMIDGAPYLAMEWLDGETLFERMARRPLTIAEAVETISRVASALGAIHRRGVVHRDLKPSNLYLARREIASVTLIDFGIARLPEMPAELTVPGTMLGTPSYVAPEQARSAATVDARADIFSLGAILYKALTGRGPFVGDDGLSVLLKVVLEDPPRLRELRPDVPARLDDLVARMLSKAPEGRPRDGDALAAELDALGEMPTPSARVAAPPSPKLELGAGERRIMCLLLARQALGPGEDTFTRSGQIVRDKALRETVERHLGRLELLADRSLFVLLTDRETSAAGAGSASDLAARAARCAIAIRAILEDVPIAVVTGRGDLSSRLPVGELLDRAVALLAASHTWAARAVGPPAVRLDDVTAGLLGARFGIEIEVADEGAIHRLRGERDAFEATRTLLGKTTPCVGRDRELALLEATVAHTIDESRASAVLITAGAGMGKSRLGHELLRRLRERGTGLSVWIARGDPMSAGSAFSLLGQALRRALCLRDGEQVEARRKRIRARTGRHALAGRLGDKADAGARADRLAEFLGELAGAPFLDDDSVQLRAARRDPMLMGDQMRRAFEDLLLAECAAGPVLLVLEDLHWGDLPTVKFVDAALRTLADRPLMVLALARPEVHELFPRLWVGREMQEIKLGELPRRAGERLVREALGEGVDKAEIVALVQRSSGNAFYLEELIRATAAGRGDALPETVLAMAQARIEEQDPDARRILRAASVFGQTFWLRGIAALLGGSDPGAWLAALADLELISGPREGRFPGEAEYSFQHALVREAAYGMLTPDDLALGHRLAASWLEQRGESDAMVLAEHFERGGEPDRAAIGYARAAAQAFEGHDLEAALARASRGIACYSSPPDLASGEDPATTDRSLSGDLFVLQAQAHRWRGENAEAERAGEEAMRRLLPGSASWCDAAGEVVMAGGKLGHPERVLAVATRLSFLPDDAMISGARVIALTRAAVYLRLGGETARAEALLDQAASFALQVPGEPAAAAPVESARASRALAEGDLGDYLRRLETSQAQLAQAGDARGACTRGLNVGYAHLQLGAAAEAVRVLRSVLADAERLGLQNVRTYAKHNLGLALGRLGDLEEAQSVEEEAVAAFRSQGDRRMECASRIYLAQILGLGARWTEAATEARAVADDEGAAAPLRAGALAVLADAERERGAHGAAISAAREAMEILEGLSGIEDGESMIRLAYAEAHAAGGDLRRARGAAREAGLRLRARADKVLDPKLRASFLERVPENARTLALSDSLLDEA
ncbi:MAG: protein kinase [Byssovorax sp.]